MAGSSPGRRAKQNGTDLCPQGDRAQAYCELEHVLREGDSRPPCGVVNRLLAEVSQDLTAAQVRGHSQRRQREPPARAGVLLADSRGLALPREGLRQSPVPRVTGHSFSGRARQCEDGCQRCLVALARTHFSLVMAELQGHLKAVGEMSKEFVLLTLSKLFTSYGRVPSAS